MLIYMATIPENVVPKIAGGGPMSVEESGDVLFQIGNAPIYW